MSYQIIDNFLPLDDFNILKEELEGISWYCTNYVTGPDSEDKFYKEQHWNWYLTHLVYNQIPHSSHYSIINQIFGPKFNEINLFKAWIRIKLNLYPYTSQVYEHEKHMDYDFNHNAAVFSLNTCDGFTRMHDGFKVDSIENRLVLFDGSLEHNSSTTSNSRNRMNINFNWL